MQIDNDEETTQEDAKAMEEADMKFLDSLANICFARSATEECWKEGNFWELLYCLRSRGLSSLFYCVNGESCPEMRLNADPKSMSELSPAQVLNACLGGSEDKPLSLPLERLNAALEWIQSCHGRKWEEMLSNDYQDSKDPLLPPPRRRTMWPSTLEALKRRGDSKNLHMDAPLLRSSSPTDVRLDPSDETDDARLLRACFRLIQSGRADQAIELTKECGQAWRAVQWIGGEPMDEKGNGNPTRRLWKNQCRAISEKMTQIVSGGVELALHSSLAYEAAILALLSDNVEGCMNNPVFGTWEDGVHAILSAERGIIEEDVLRSHDDARAEGMGNFPFPGTEGGRNDVDVMGCDGDMAAALQRLDTSSLESVREANGDPYRNGMRSFLVGREGVKQYMEECSALALELEEDEAYFLRFVVHLVLYVDTVLPELTFRLALPNTDDSVSLREVLFLKYTAHLSSRRDLWPYVPLYTSLLTQENILATFSDFLVHVHTDGERQMMLKEARDFFPDGLDRYVLRNVVREMIQCDEEKFLREPGEELPPKGVSPGDARMMRSVLWLCYHPEHFPEALVCANMLLRRFMLTSEDKDQYSKSFMYAPKVFIDQIFPKEVFKMAGEHSQDMNDTIAGCISLQMIQNLQAEYLSIKRFLEAHNSFVHFINAITKTSPCHKSESKSVKGSGAYENEIAQKLERNDFRKKKTGLCKIVIEYATKVSDALMEVLTFSGGWLVDHSLDQSGDYKSEEAAARLEEMKEIRSAFVPMAIFMLHEVLNKTAMWMEQVVHDTVDQFGDASPDMLFTLFSTFDDSEEVTARMLKTSPAAPAYWHKKAVSMASIVANDDHELHEAVGDKDMQKFLGLVADSQVKYIECSDADALFDL